MLMPDHQQRAMLGPVLCLVLALALAASVLAPAPPFATVVLAYTAIPGTPMASANDPGAKADKANGDLSFVLHGASGSYIAAITTREPSGRSPGVLQVVETPTGVPTATPTVPSFVYLPFIVKNWPPPTPTPTPTVITYVYLPVVIREWPQPTPTPTRTPMPSGDPGFAYGVQAHMLVNEKSRVADAVRDLGFGWLKQQVEWREAEPSKGNYNWGGLDEVVEAANSKGIRVLFSVLRSPSWASVYADSPPRDFNDYGDFVGALATRYKDRGMAYEIWNEQNLKREWMGYPIGNPSWPVGACKYVELLKIAYARIKAADPRAMVVTGGLTPTGVNDPNIAIDDRTYLRQMYGCGMRGWFDGLGAHPSGYNNPPDVDWNTWYPPGEGFKGHPSFFFKATMEDYRNTMVANGDGARRIWITEFGWAVGSPLPGYEYAADNTEEERAAWVVKAYQISKNWGFVGVAALWNLNFRIIAPGSEQALFGILESDWGQTLTYGALRDMPK
jgi:hypothetical protein